MYLFAIGRLIHWVEQLLKYDLVRFGSLICSILKCYSLFARLPAHVLTWRRHSNKQIMDGWYDKNVQKGLGPWYDGIRGATFNNLQQPLSSHGWHILIEQLWAWQRSLWARLMTWNSNSFGRPASSSSYLSWPGSHRPHPLHFSRPPPPPPRGAPPRSRGISCPITRSVASCRQVVPPDTPRPNNQGEFCTNTNFNR